MADEKRVVNIFPFRFDVGSVEDWNELANSEFTKQGQAKFASLQVELDKMIVNKPPVVPDPYIPRMWEIVNEHEEDAFRFYIGDGEERSGIAGSVAVSIFPRAPIGPYDMPVKGLFVHGDGDGFDEDRFRELVNTLLEVRCENVELNEKRLKGVREANEWYADMMTEIAKAVVPTRKWWQLW